MAFSSGCNYTKLKTNLRLVMNRLKLLEKKKTELALKARKEIADYIQLGKNDRARIRVEHIIREDLMVEAMEIIEMFCDLLLARIGLLQTMKDIDPGLEEAIASILWAAPRLQSDVPEMKQIIHELTSKYKKEFVFACQQNRLENVNERMLSKMSIQAPNKILVEKYMVEIAKAFDVPFTPDSTVMESELGENALITLDEKPGPCDFTSYPSVPSTIPPPGGIEGGGIPGGIGLPYPSFEHHSVPQPHFPSDIPPSNPFNYPSPGVDAKRREAEQQVPPALPNVGPEADDSHLDGGVNPHAPPFTQPRHFRLPGTDPPPYEASRVHNVPGSHVPLGLEGLPDLPDVPGNPPSESFDFDDLSRRFEQLKKK